MSKYGEGFGILVEKPGDLTRPCHFCGVEIRPYEPGTSLNETYGTCHTKCLYDFWGEEVPEILN